jgi:hypothetical protein
MGYIHSGKGAPEFGKKIIRGRIDMDEAITQGQRITEILGADNMAVTLKSLTLYRQYLSRTLDPSCVMTGVEGPSWEEKNMSGIDNTPGHEVLKKEQASCTDIYELKRFEELIDEITGILVKVKRVNDNHRFILELASLKAVDEASKNYTLLDDYSVWFANR